nr:MAG TPA: hypothetical protein [Caudoviricetes sp.]
MRHLRQPEATPGGQSAATPSQCTTRTITFSRM